MKRTIHTLAILLVAIVAMTSCTHNNGDIGPWFGMWHVETIECDGQVLDTYHGNNFFAFQSSVFQLRYSDDLQTDLQTTGIWAETDGGIDVSFPDEELLWVSHFDGIDWHGVNHFKVEKMSGKDLILTLNSIDGHHYRYTLHRLA